MWVVVHLYVGLAIAVLVPWPFWALFLLVIGSHVLLDLIPHWDYTRSRHRVPWSVCDFLAGLLTVLVGYIALHLSAEVVVLGILAAAPDFDVLVKTLRGDAGQYWFPSHWQRFPHGRCGPAVGIGVQVAVVAACGLAMALA